MDGRTGSEIIGAWPEESREAAQLVIDQYGEPAEATEFFTPLADFDGSVIVERTAGEISARCHDEEANSLALNLAHDIVTGEKTVEEAREYYAKEFVDYRRKKPTPYMDELRFEPDGEDTTDRDERMLSDEDLKQAEEEGKQAETGATVSSS